MQFLSIHSRCRCLRSCIYCFRVGYHPRSFDIATCLSHIGIDPFTKKEVKFAKGMWDCKMQRTLMHFFKPENWFAVREALIEAKRTDLIGDGCDCLIPANPPKEALEARRRAANRAVKGDEDNDHYRTVANPARGEKPGERGADPPKPTGYRPGRKPQKRQQGKRKGSGPQA
jgi:hypothetical protein